MKTTLFYILLAAVITGAACREEPLPNMGAQQANNGATAKDDDTDGTSCQCNPCNPNVHFGNINAELSPKMNCYEECNGIGYNLTTLRLQYESLYSQTCFLCYISLANQSVVIQGAVQKALQFRPSGKLILNITFDTSFVNNNGTTYYYVYPIVTYGSCSPADTD